MLIGEDPESDLAVALASLNLPSGLDVVIGAAGGLGLLLVSMAAAPAFLAFAIVPVGGEITIADRTTRLQLADPPVGILFLLAVSSIAVYGVMLAGWSSGSKYPLLGSVRASAQMVSYEAALGLSIATVVPAPTTSEPRIRWTETWMRSWKRVCSRQSAGMSSVVPWQERDELLDRVALSRADGHGNRRELGNFHLVHALLSLF